MSKRPIEFDDEQVQAMDLRNHIVFVFDSSSSMQKISASAVDFFNAQIDAAREGSKNMKTVVSMLEFATTVKEPRFWAVPLESVEKLGENAYRPYGDTALYDGVGDAIDRLTASDVDMADERLSFLIITITDGEENISKKYNATRLAARIAELQKSDRWTFSYMGANQDLSKLEEALNIPKGNTTTWSNENARTVMDASLRSATGIKSFYSARSSGQTMSRSMYSSPLDDVVDLADLVKVDPDNV